MAKRRGNNEGSIYKRSNGTWRAQVKVMGRRLSFTAESKTECQQWIRKTNHQIDQGFTFRGVDVKLKDFLKNWLLTVKSSRSPRTFDLYARYMKDDVVPIIGKQTLIKVTPEIVQGMYDYWLSKGKSNHHVNNLHKIFNVAMSHAVKLGMIPRNPCKGTTPPKRPQREMQFYDEYQVQQLLNTAQMIEDQYYPVYFLAIHTGMRLGELLGLKWEDIDFDRRTLQVKRQLARTGGGVIEFSAPKSKRGIRKIILGKQAVEVLKDQEKRVAEMRQKAESDWRDFDMVFPTRVGTPTMHSNLRRGFRALLAESGLPKIRFHDLRHTAASLMLNNGIPVLIVSRRLGHSKPSITLDVYGHLIQHKQEEAADLMDDLMTPIEVKNDSIFALELHPDDKLPKYPPHIYRNIWGFPQGFPLYVRTRRDSNPQPADSKLLEILSTPYICVNIVFIVPYMVVKSVFWVYPFHRFQAIGNRLATVN